MPWWVSALSVAAWILLAAKAHGRQVRLEREQQGVFHVEFGGSNPAAVEAIWAADRRRFWASMAAGALILLGGAALRRDAVAAGFALPLAFAMAFTVAGLASWADLARRKQGALPWRRRAMLGSAGWWSGVLAAAALTLWTWLG
jgi:hypothetical protein